MLSKRLDSRIHEVKGHLNWKNDSSANSEFTSPTYNAPLCRKENGNSPKARENIEERFNSTKIYSQVSFYKQNYEIGIDIVFSTSVLHCPTKKISRGRH